MEIKPRVKQVLVQQDEEESRTSANGLITPDSVEQEQKAFGTVIAVGEGIDDLKEGDRVIFGAFAGEKIELKKEKVEYVLLFDEDVLATIV